MVYFWVMGEDMASAHSWPYIVGIWSTPLSTGIDFISVENNGEVIVAEFPCEYKQSLGCVRPAVLMNPAINLN